MITPHFTNMDGSGKRLLVADDDADNRESVAAILRMDGFEVDVAKDGTDALTAFQACDYDVAIVDMTMPGLSGYELAVQLRRVPSKTVMIAMTGWGRDEDRVRALACGFHYHLVKPLDWTMLHQLLSTVITSGSTTVST